MRHSLTTLILIIATSSIAAQTHGSSVNDEGPHLFHGPDGSVTAKWIEKGTVRSRRFEKGDPVVLPRFRALLGERLTLEPHQPPPATWDMPDKLIAISDVEGEYPRLRRFLKNHGVIDADDRWSFGKGHLACVGDFVDRGTEVTETLWLMYRLQREAKAAGGCLHFVLGNHEVMMMGGDVRYTAPKYQAVASRLGTTIPGLVGADTEIGRWLRAQNAIVRVGDVTFVHAGLAPELVSPLFDHRGVNAVLRKGIGQPRANLGPVTLELLWGRRGPLWYRGYFPRFADGFGPTPPVATLATQIERLGTSVVVVGHSKVPEVSYVDAGRHVLAIDTTWVADGIVRGVLFEGGRLTVLGLDGPLPRVTLAPPAGRSRAR